MTKDEALKMALEALEWSYGGEPMPSKELEAINAIRQVLADQKKINLTDDEIKNLADEAGAWAAGLNVESPSVFGLFKRFAKVIEQRTLTNQKAKWYQEGVEAEREACAKVCDDTQNHYIRRADVEQMTIDQDKVKAAIIVCDQVADRIRARGEWTPDDTAYRPDGLSQEELPPVKSYCGGKPNYCEPEMDKQCSSCGGFCGEVCEREDVKSNLLNQTCCECGRSGGFALYCGWCWSKGDKPVADVNTSEERVPNPDKQRHEWQGLTTEQRNNIMQKHGNDWKRYTEELERQLRENNNG